MYQDSPVEKTKLLFVLLLIKGKLLVRVGRKATDPTPRLAEG